jgi:dTMP kinase
MGTSPLSASPLVRRGTALTSTAASFDCAAPVQRSRQQINRITGAWRAVVATSSGYTRAVTTRGGSAARGRFITIEGPEGGGKTRQAAALHERLHAAGLPALLTREPGGTTIGERIRDVLLDAGSDQPLDPWTDALLFTAARAQLVREVIRPALADGTTVVCARFSDSTLAYQGFGMGLPVDELRRLQDLATDRLWPDLTLLLDLPPEVGLRRKTGQEETRFEAGFDLAFHRRVRDGFRTLADREPARFVIIDATPGPHIVLDALLEAVRGRFPELRGIAGKGPVPAGTRSEPEVGTVRTTR